MSLRARVAKLERMIGHGEDSGCERCGWPGPDQRLRGHLTDADRDRFRSLYAAAETRRQAAGAQRAAGRAGRCPRCGWPADGDRRGLWEYLTVDELQEARAIYMAAYGLDASKTPEGTRARMAEPQAPLAEERPP